MRSLAKEYAVSVFSFWKMHVSGWILALAAIGLSIAAAVVIDDASASARVVKWSAFILGGAALCVMIGAQYDAWKEQFLAREKAEAKLNASADMRGTITVQVTQANWLLVTSVGTPPEPAIVLGFRFVCANHGHAECEISRLCFITQIAGRQPVEQILHLDKDIVKMVAPKGEFYGWQEFSFVRIGVEDLPHIDITAYLVDSLDIVYRNTKTITNFAAQVANRP